MDSYDVIVIGGGLGGLTAGAKLAKEGKKVLLLEQHHSVGGCATGFQRKGYSMQVSLHALDGLDESDPKKKIFENLGVFEKVEFVRLPEFYRFSNDRFDVSIPFDSDEATEVLAALFPKERAGIKKFFRTVHAIKNEISNLPNKKWKMLAVLPIVPFLYPNLILNTYQTLGKFLDSTIRDEDLKLILGANIQYYHDDPYSMSLIYFSVAQASYYRGGHFIKGGAQKLSDHLADVIRSHRGKILLGALATKILIKNGAASGVEYQVRGGRKETRRSSGKTIVVNSPMSTVSDLLPGKYKKIVNKETGHLEAACSILSIYIGFKKCARDLGSRNYSMIVFDQSVKSQGDLLANHQGSFERRNFAFVDYSQIDSGLAGEGKSFGMACTTDYIFEWDKLSEREYQEQKERVAQIFFKRLERLIPNITAEIECYEVGTSKTIQKFTLNPSGTVYGFAQIPTQSGIFRQPNQSPIKKMYYASAWATPGGGFTGAILSGWFCANKILGRR